MRTPIGGGGGVAGGRASSWLRPPAGNRPRMAPRLRAVLLKRLRRVHPVAGRFAAARSRAAFATLPEI